MDWPQEEALFGRWLRKRRKVLDLTQKALARRVGCSPATIRKLEADERHPSRHVARALAEALGVPESEHDAFIGFARRGWADDPPAGPRADLESPWSSHGGAVGLEQASNGAHGPFQAPVASPEGLQIEEQDGSPDAPRILARETELQQLERELERALAGDGRAALIAGDAGQGKTALMTAFAGRAQAAHPDLLVAIGTCNAYTGRGDPFLPFRQILAQLTGEVSAGPQRDAFERVRSARLLRAAPRAAGTLLEHGPGLIDALVPGRPLQARLRHAGASLSALPALATPALAAAAIRRGAQNDQQALRAETAAALTAIADVTPLLLVLDDLHWLDDSSAELLLHLARIAPGHPMLLLGAYRPGDLPTPRPEHRAPHPLHELARGHAVTVDLDRADGRAFVEAWLDSEANDLDSDFRASLWRQTAGQPLFTIELLRAMQERGDLVKDEAGRWTAAATLRWAAVPSRIADALANRIGRLVVPSQELMRVASVEGETFTAEVAAHVMGLDPRQVVSVLGGELDRVHHLVAAVDVRRSAAGLVSRYRFRHNLIQRYVYDGIDESERAYLHQSVAQALESQLGDEADPVALALHYSNAHAPERAAIHHRKAGDRARLAHAVDQAIEHYQAALDHWTDDDLASRGALQRDLGECQYLRLRLEHARRNFAEARSAFETAGDLRAAGRMQLGLGAIAMFQDDHAGALDAASRAVAMLEPLGESAELAAALTDLGEYHGMVSEFAEGAVLARRAMTMAEHVGAGDVLAHATGGLGAALPRLEPPRHEEAIGLLERSFQLADELGQALHACQSSFNLADLLNGIGRYREARDRYRSCLAYARRHQIAQYEYHNQYWLWTHTWAHGDWTTAFERLPLIRRLYEGTGPLEFDVWSFGIELASQELDLGRAEQASAILDRHEAALRRLSRPSERLPGLEVHLRVATTLGRQDDADRDAAAIVDAVMPEPPLEYDIVGAVLGAVRHLLSRSTDDADARITACLDALERLERQYGSAEARATLWEARALTAAKASASESSALWTRAADLWQAGTFPLREARARAAAARSFRSVGRESEASSQLERARGLLSDLSKQITSDELRAGFAGAARRILSTQQGGPG